MSGFGAPVEHRAFQVRAENARTLTGYAALFDEPTTIGNFTETVARGAFQQSLNSDVLAMMDHDASKVLGRTKSGTLQLRENEKGLAFTLSLPDTAAGRDVIALAERGDLGGASFGFIVRKGGDSWDGNARTLRSVDLKEISIVSAWPAYEKTAHDLALRRASYHQDWDRRLRLLAIAEAQQWE